MKNYSLKTFIALCLSIFIFNSCTKDDDYNKEENILSTEKDDISYSKDDPSFGKFLDEINNKLSDLKRNEKKLSHEDIEMFIDSIIISKEKTSRTQGGDDLNNYIIGKLNSKEKELYNSNRTKALLCMANGKMAINYSESNYENNVLHNGNGDAFRHILWNFGMTEDVGSTFAKKWSDAHEYGATGQPLIERNMDLYNNAIGIQLGKDNSFVFFHSTFISKSKEKVRSGKAKIIKYGRLYPSNSYGEK